MNSDFHGKVAVVTGGTRGIGQAIVQVLSSRGASVIATGKDPSNIKTLSGMRNVRYVAVDFLQQDSLQRFCRELDREDRIDILVNNAGINRIQNIEEAPEADYDELANVNVRAPYVLCKEVFPRMKANNYGRIVNIASIWSIVSKAGRSIYSMNKHALVGLARTLAIEGGPHNVLVNCVSPGFTATELTASTLTKAEIDALAAQIPLRRLARPVEIANVVTFLCSAENTYLSGQNIVVDGGFTSV